MSRGAGCGRYHAHWCTHGSGEGCSRVCLSFYRLVAVVEGERPSGRSGSSRAKSVNEQGGENLGPRLLRA